MLSVDPHQDCALHYAGASLDQAALVVIAVHGRYGATRDILKYADQIDAPHVAWVAPQASGGSWWDESFLAALARNEPGLLSAMRRLDTIIAELGKHDFGPEQIVLIGFSQGACLVLEYIARHPKSFRGIVGMSGGLLGTAEGDGKRCDNLYGHRPKKFEYDSKLTDLPVHLGCHSDDPVIPIARVHHSGDVLRQLGAKVTIQTTPGKMHGVMQSDLDALTALVSTSSGGFNG